MALLITDECISCGACLPECPNEAIFETRSDAEAKGNHVGDGQGVGDSIYIGSSSWRVGENSMRNVDLATETGLF